MATNALGPTFAGGMQPIVVDGLEIIYYPDVNNNALQEEGKSPVFYWLPNYVHLARKDGKENGDLLFTLIRFSGVQSGDTTVGVGPGETREVAGGVLGFTVTSAPTDHVLQKSQEQIMEMFRGKSDYFWGIRSTANPIFRPAPIVSNETTVSNLSPTADGTHPSTAEAVATPAAPEAPADENGAPPGRDVPGHLIQGLLQNTAGDRAPASVKVKTREVSKMSVRALVNSDRFILDNQRRSIPYTEMRSIKSRSNLDPWFWKMQGQGKGPIDPMAQDAYTALIGAFPTALLWESFHGAYSPMFVDHLLKVKFWTPQIELTIKGKWDRIFQHFSAHATGRYLWFSADVKAELNSMRISGDIQVDLKIDSTIPNGEKIVEMIEKRSDLILEKFMDEAKKIIFDPPQPTVAAAEASSGGLSSLWGAGLALKYRRDETKLDLYYHETRQIAYLQEVPISGSLEGMYDEIQNNPEAEKKYFHTVYMDDWPRKLGRIIKPVVNWNAQPVAFISAQVGYPNTRGHINWVGKTFQRTDPDDATWSFGMSQKMAEDVKNAPAGWKPDVTYLKRKVHFNEPPSAMEDPFNRIQIDGNEIVLDPGELGVAVNDVTIETRADDAGRIQVGPISIAAELENSKQVIEVVFMATNENGAPLNQVKPAKFIWNYDDQQESRTWAVYSMDTNIKPYFRYQVKVRIKGNLFTKGMEWTGPWVNTLGNGPIMLTIPTPEDEGVTQRGLSFNETSEPVPGEAPPANTAPPAAVMPPGRSTRATQDDAMEITPFYLSEAEARGEFVHAEDAASTSNRGGSVMPPSSGSGRDAASKAISPRAATMEEEAFEITAFRVE